MFCVCDVGAFFGRKGRDHYLSELPRSSHVDSTTGAAKISSAQTTLPFSSAIT